MATQTFTFASSDIPDLSSKIAIVTGGNIGIGLATVEQLLRHGATVIMACRSQQRMDAAIAELIKDTKVSPEKLVGLILDVSSLASIEQFVTNFSSKYDRLDILVNNAGVFVPPFSKTDLNFEVTMGTNSIGPQHLTNRLLPLLVKSTDARVTFVSSFRNDDVTLSSFAKSITDLGGEKLTATTEVEYCLSKLCNKFTAVELQRRFDQAGITNVTFTATNPGAVATDIINKAGFSSFFKAVIRIILPLMAVMPPKGALPSLFLTTHSNKEEIKGKMFGMGKLGWAKDISSSPVVSKADTAENATKIFELIDQLVVAKGFQGFQLPSSQN